MFNKILNVSMYENFAAKFLYQRPEFPTNQQQKQTLQIQQQQVGIAEPEEWEEYVDEGDEMFQMDEGNVFLTQYCYLFYR
jgi:hypothetical protein